MERQNSGWSTGAREHRSSGAPELREEHQSSGRTSVGDTWGSTRAPPRALEHQLWKNELSICPIPTGRAPETANAQEHASIAKECTAPSHRLRQPGWTRWGVTKRRDGAKRGNALGRNEGAGRGEARLGRGRAGRGAMRRSRAGPPSNGRAGDGGTAWRGAAQRLWAGRDEADKDGRGETTRDVAVRAGAGRGTAMGPGAVRNRRGAMRASQNGIRRR